MKNLIVIALALLSICATASPRLDTAIGTPDPNFITVVPDSADANLYYLFPQRFGLAMDEQNRFRFLYQEYSAGWFTVKANVEMVFTPLFDKGLVDAKVKAIKAQNANAKFAFVPVYQSNIQPPQLLYPAIEASDCKISGMVIGQDVVCHEQIKDGGRALFVDRLRSGLMNVFELNYRFVATISGKEVPVDHTIAMYAGGVQGEIYYLDKTGKPLNSQSRLRLMAELFDLSDQATFITVDEARQLWGIE